ncbi:hypothetical protein V6N13_093377 [Hibiscus sabdariffa]
MRTGTAMPYRYDFSYWNLFKTYRTDTVAPVSEHAFPYRYDMHFVSVRYENRTDTCRSALMAGLKLLNGHIDDLNNQNG